MKALKNWKTFLKEAIVRGTINGLVVSIMTFVISTIILQQQPLALSLKSQIIALVIQRLVVWVIVKIIEHKAKLFA